jgi:hypothetical protein
MRLAHIALLSLVATSSFPLSITAFSAMTASFKDQVRVFIKQMKCQNEVR